MMRILLFFLLFFSLSFLESRDTLDPTPYVLPKHHRLKPILDKIFSDPTVLQSEETLEKAGFTTLYARLSSFVHVLSHPKLSGYLVKAYLENETRHRPHFTGQEWLIRRCIGAEKIRTLIQKHRLRFFTVPKKWLYELPTNPHTFVVIAQKMNIVPQEETYQAWKTVASPAILDELFFIMQHGCASTLLCENVPYTREGTFSFIDTEYPKRKLHLTSVLRFLSPEMQLYWKQLIANKGPTHL